MNYPGREPQAAPLQKPWPLGAPSAREVSCWLCDKKPATSRKRSRRQALAAAAQDGGALSCRRNPGSAVRLTPLLEIHVNLRVAEPRASGKCPVPYNRLFPCGEEPLKFFDWLDSTKQSASHLDDKAGSREIAGVFPGRRVSSNHQILASSRFLFLFR